MICPHLESAADTHSPEPRWTHAPHRSACAWRNCEKRCPGAASTRCWCRAATRTCPSTCRRAGRAGCGCRASPARWPRWWWAASVRRSSPTAATGCRLKASCRAPASTWCASIPPPSPAHLDWLVEQVPRGGCVAVDGQVLGLAAAQALKSRLDAAGIVLRTAPDCWMPSGPTAPRCRRSRCMPTVRRMRRAHAPPSWRWCAKRWRGTARRNISSPPSMTSPG